MLRGPAAARHPAAGGRPGHAVEPDAPHYFTESQLDQLISEDEKTADAYRARLSDFGSQAEWTSGFFAETPMTGAWAQFGGDSLGFIDLRHHQRTRLSG